MQQFPRFTDLPAELRIQIWQDARPKPAIHAFDVCTPSCSPCHTKEAIERFNLARHEGGITAEVFLDPIAPPRAKTLLPVETDNDNQQNPYCNIEFGSISDPSMYIITNNIRQSCGEANAALGSIPPSPKGVNTKDLNSVHLPARGRDKRIWYDNSTDVLFLRFGALLPTDSMILIEIQHTNTSWYTSTFRSNLSILLQRKWSPQFASTLKNARRVALDVTEITSDIVLLGPSCYLLVLGRVAKLSCFLCNDLEVLYIVDHCVGRCRKCGKDSLDIDKMAIRAKSGLSRELGYDEEERSPDVFYGNGVTYREVFALEKLGWNEKSPAFLVSKLFAEEIRKRQKESGRQKPCFQGVRVLACQESGNQADG